MTDKIKAILADFTTADTLDADENTTLATDLGLSSFDLISLITTFEDEFNIEIPDKDIKNLITIGDVREYIESKM